MSLSDGTPLRPVGQPATVAPMPSSLITSPDAVPAPPEQRPTLTWLWSADAVKHALANAGAPPALDIQAMLNAAFAVDGPALTAFILELTVRERMAELDTEPVVIPVPDVTSVECNGGFFLALLTGRLDILSETVVPVAAPETSSTPAEEIVK